MKANMLCWFEIPVSNMERAVKFYETVFNIKITVQEFCGTQMGWFPASEDKDAAGAGGSLIYNPKHYSPGTNGVLIYLSSQVDDVSVELNKVEAAGGKPIVEKMQITEEIGYMAAFIDTEGNRIAIHSKN
ncbi:VOC family protein [Lutibacter sp. TH_r2]|uniref:VOC family protein n=1 Tax=Lutibacter sp. TH_r2 TaxID=3082083 RepID=UPI002953D7BB|nr:VOC family protein [Lutibacter sp. TH_r2]MDV7187151.1 VOC family protein [Lutibacter sp. TH_r2]